MIITNDWYDIAMNIIGKVKHASSQDEDGQGYVSMKLILTNENAETDDRNVHEHDISETFVSLHSEELDDLLTFHEVRDYIIEQAIDNEKYIRTYKTDRGLYNFIAKMIHSDDAFALVRG